MLVEYLMVSVSSSTVSRTLDVDTTISWNRFELPTAPSFLFVNEEKIQVYDESFSDATLVLSSPIAYGYIYIYICLSRR